MEKYRCQNRDTSILLINIKEFKISIYFDIALKTLPFRHSYSKMGKGLIYQIFLNKFKKIIHFETKIIT